MKRAILYPLIGTLFGASACASVESQVVARAAHDFSCQPQETHILDADHDLYLMQGCGFTATYACRESASLSVRCAPVEPTLLAISQPATND